MMKSPPVAFRFRDPMELLTAVSGSGQVSRLFKVHKKCALELYHGALSGVSLLVAWDIPGCTSQDIHFAPSGTMYSLSRDL